MVYAGFDVGGTGIQIGIVDEKGTILCKGGIVTRTDIPFEDQVKAMADCALAAENMFLQATAMGIGSCYINQIHWLTENPRMLQVLQSIGLPEDELIFAGAAFGFSAMGEQTPLQRFGNPITYIK